MKVTFYGHSCFAIGTNGKTILIDPFITDNELASHIDIEKIHADYILISHGHEDHLGDVLSIAKRTEAQVISTYEVTTWLNEKGIANTYPMNIGGEASLDFGTVLCVHAPHSASFPDGSYAGISAGFVVWNDVDAWYFAGDSALTWDMKLIPMLCPKLDVAILPIGDVFTMGVRHALIASDFVECDTIIGCHYDTYEDIKIDPVAAKAAFEAKGKKLILLPIGESLNVGN